jgi:hypothetical protein
MHPRQHHAFAGKDPPLSLVPTLARTGLLNMLFDRRDGDPTRQARQFVRDIDEMPAELNRAAKLTSLGNPPLAVITAGTGSAAGWPGEQDNLATLSHEQRPPHRRRRDAPVAHRRRTGRGPIEPGDPRRRQGSADRRRMMGDTWTGANEQRGEG